MLGIAIDGSSAVLVAWLGAAILFRQQPSELRRGLLLVHGAVLLFIAGDMGTLLADDLRREDAALILLYAGAMSIPPCLLRVASSFAASYERRPDWLPPKAVRTAFVLALLFWFAAATNSWHGQFITPVLGGRNEHHWLWWIASGWSYLVLAVTLAVIASVASHRDLHPTARIQCGLLALAISVPFAANVAYNLTDWSSAIDPSVPGFATTVALVGLGVHGVGLFGLSPVSTREALLATAGALLVVDRSGRERVANAQARALLTGLGAPPSGDAVSTLAARLLHAETDEVVSASELWALARTEPEKRAGALYRVNMPSSMAEQWLWVTAVPIRSRWREAAAYCFRATDVTALQMLRRDNDALARRALGPIGSGGVPERNRGGETIRAEDWRSTILHRMESHEIFANDGIDARAASETLDEIELDAELLDSFARATPDTIWREFERRLSERMRRR